MGVLTGKVDPMTSTRDAAGLGVVADRESASPVTGELVLDSGSQDARARLGPTAWFVLEQLLMEGDKVDDQVVVATAVRALAEVVGLSKDTVVSAIRRLTRAGIVWREHQRDSVSGRFGHSRYVVDIRTTGLRLSAQLGPVPGAGTAVAPGEATGQAVPRVAPRRTLKASSHFSIAMR